MSNTQKPSPSLGRLLSFSSGALGFSILDRVLAAAVIYYYLPPEGSGLQQLVSFKVFGLIFIFGRVIDSIADPLVSYWSDKSRSPRGRRVPFMLYGGLPLAVCLALLFFPPRQYVSMLNAAYLAVVLGAFFFFFTYYVCPFLGLIPELAKTPTERINLTSYVGLLQLVGVIIASVFCIPVAASIGYGNMAIIFAGGSLLFLYAPVAAIKERKYCDATPCQSDLVGSLTATFKNKPFVIYLIGNVSFWFGFNIITQGIAYYVTVLLKRPEQDMMYFMAATFGVTLAFIPILNVVTKKMGKRSVMIALLVIFAVILPMIFFVNAPWLPISGSLLMFMILGVAGVPLAGLFIVPNAIVADLTDYDEMQTGQRREAMYFGAQGFFLKVTMGISTYLMTGVLFEYFGNSVASPMGVQLTGPVGGLFALIGAVAFLAFPGDIEKKVLEFRKSQGSELQ